MIFLAIGMLQSGREIVSLSSSSFPTLTRFFFFGGPLGDVVVQTGGEHEGRVRQDI